MIMEILYALVALAIAGVLYFGFNFLIIWNSGRKSKKEQD
jgi:hypothetical protein